ncbi:MAG: hypothetical protein WC900_05500 [Oscillospiraceae bacterium]|jgi:hypothetical protein
MIDWWNGLEPFLRIAYCIAIPATLLLVVQTILTIVGFGDSGEGMDFSDTSGIDMDIDVDTDVSDGSVYEASDISQTAGAQPFQFFTIQGFVTFLCVFGWLTIALRRSGASQVISSVIGFLTGAIAMYGIAKLFQATLKLQSNGTLNINNAVGKSATVYIRIPGKAAAAGKVNVVIQERLVECDAITLGKNDLPTGSSVKITAVKNGVLVCESDT